MKRLAPIKQVHGTTVDVPFQHEDGLALFHQAFPRLAESGYSGVDNNGALLPSATGWPTQLAQTPLKETDHSIDFSLLYETFYGDRYRQLDEDFKRDMTGYARDTAQLLASKCVGWHEDEHADAEDLRLMLVLLATPGKWQLQLASQPMTREWNQWVPSDQQSRHVNVQHVVDMERGTLLGFHQGYLHRMISTGPVTPKQQPLLMLSFPSVTL